MRQVIRVFSAVALLAGSTQIHASIVDDVVGPGVTVINDNFSSLAGDIAPAFTYKSNSPAASAADGILPVGLDAGLEVSATQLPTGSFLNGLLPSWMQGMAYLPFPKLHAHVGVDIPFVPLIPAVDIGVSYLSLPNTISHLGGELKVNIASGNVLLPAVAVRGVFSNFAGSYGGTDLAKMSSYGAELAISKGFGIGLKVTPFAGLGFHRYTASSDMTLQYLVDQNVSQTIRDTFAAQFPNLNDKIIKDVSGNLFKWFIGANLQIFLINVAVEMDQTGGVLTYTGKLGVRF
ncbi:MAG: hypothetical protein OEZ43_13230 [Gammaproteobacteria bacterium]|nr:hypothetical protein [Gammaproteobacteria bacterium]